MHSAVNVEICASAEALPTVVAAVGLLACVDGQVSIQGLLLLLISADVKVPMISAHIYLWPPDNFTNNIKTRFPVSENFRECFLPRGVAL